MRLLDGLADLSAEAQRAKAEDITRSNVGRVSRRRNPPNSRRMGNADYVSLLLRPTRCLNCHFVGKVRNPFVLAGKYRGLGEATVGPTKQEKSSYDQKNWAAYSSVRITVGTYPTYTCIHPNVGSLSKLDDT